MVLNSDISTQLAYARRAGLLPFFEQAARKWSIPVEILLAVASRETGIGTDPYYLANGFTGRDGHGKGIMQIDDRWHHFATVTAPNNHQKMIDYGAQFLSQLKERFGNIKDALSAYNAGPGSVLEAHMQGIDPDTYTTGGDYAKDVLQRAKTVKEILYPASPWLAMLRQVFLPASLVVGGGLVLYNEYQKTK